MQPVKQRRRLTLKETNLLNQVFQNTPAPDAMLRATLGIKLSMSSRAVQIWFQNKRAQAKRLNKENSLTENVPELTVDVQQVSPLKSPTSGPPSSLQYIRKPPSILPKSENSADDSFLNDIHSLLYPAESVESEMFTSLKTNVLITLLMQDYEFEQFMNIIGKELNVNIPQLTERVVSYCGPNSDIPNEKLGQIKTILAGKIKNVEQLLQLCEKVFIPIERCVIEQRCETCYYCKFWKDCSQIPFMFKTKKYCVQYLQKFKSLLENMAI